MKNIILFTLIFQCALCSAQDQGVILTSGGINTVQEYYHHPTIPVDKNTFTVITPSAKPFFKELLLEYEAYCSEIVLDTVTEYGRVIPRTQGHTDTAWIGYKCREFKSGGEIVMTLGLHPGGWQIVDGMGNVLEDHPGPVHVERLHICAVKRREVEPWSEDFWNWIKN